MSDDAPENKLESGLETIRRKLKSGELSAMHTLMNMKTAEVGEGWSVIEATALPEFDNAYGRTHGGFAATLIDTALGIAVMTHLPGGTPAGTIDLNIKYVRKIDPATGKLFARGKVVHGGRTLVTAEARVEDGNGLLYAHGSGSFLVYSGK
jgi:acyl-CoA thioesterase